MPEQLDDNYRSEESKISQENSSSDKLNENRDRVVLKQKLTEILKYIENSERSPDRKMRDDAVREATRRIESILGLKIPKGVEPKEWIKNELKRQRDAVVQEDHMSDYVCENYPEIFFIKTLPSQKREDRMYHFFLEKAARSAVVHDPKVALLYFNSYREQPYADELLEAAVSGAADICPIEALFFIDRYINKPYAKEILEKVIYKLQENDPKAIIDYYGSYLAKRKYYNAMKMKDKDFIVEDGVMNLFSQFAESSFEVAFRNVAKKDPKMGILFAEKYNDRRHADEVMEASVRILAELDPCSALLYFNHYMSKPYAKEILELATRRAAVTDPKWTLFHLTVDSRLYQDQPYIKEVFEQAMKNLEITDPEAAKFYRNIGHHKTK